MVNYFKVIGDCNDDDNAPTFQQFMPTPPGRFCIRLQEHAKGGLAGFPLAPLQRSHNERIRVYTITFLPPGMYLYFYLYMLINKISSKKLKQTSNFKT